MKRGIGFSAVLVLLLTISPMARAFETKSPDANRPSLQEFALDLYAQLRTQEGNLALSPFSVSSAMLLLAEGAEGATLKEFETVFRLRSTWAESREGLLATVSDLEGRDADGLEIAVANGLWITDEVSLLESYREAVAKGLQARIDRADIRDDPASAVDAVNRFVSEATRGKIPQLLSSLDPRTRMVLANAVYFKGLWEQPFPEANTRGHSFRSPDGTSRIRPFMHMRARFGYFEDDSLQVLEMPYRGGDTCMLLILPRELGGLPAVEGVLDARRFDALVTGIREREVDVFVPRFKVESTFDESFLPSLEKLGLKTALTASADFSGMTGGRDLFVDAGIHKAVVEVNEKGTEAAAATSFMMKATSAQPEVPVFRADHPFLFVIRDVPTGTILFLGRVEMPSPPPTRGS